jgi:nucleoside-diphosphate-sugar epimerase
VLASSFYVFANYPAGAVVNEESALDVMGLEIFGAAKAMSERIVRQYAQSYQIEWAAGRFGSIYGYNPCPTAKGSNAVRTFIELGLKGQPLEVWGPGNRRNQYTLLKDVVDGLELLATSEQGAYNLISPEETTTGELARFLETRYGFQVVFNLERPEGASMAYMSARKAIRDLGWLHTPLAKGIEETVTALQDQA